HRYSVATRTANQVGCVCGSAYLWDVGPLARWGMRCVVNATGCRRERRSGDEDLWKGDRRGRLGRRVGGSGNVCSSSRYAGGAGRPGALSGSLINPTDMGTGGVLAAQALAEKINQGFSEVFVTSATGFSGISLVDMDGVQLDGVPLTPAEASALNGQATLQVRE